MILAEELKIDPESRGYAAHLPDDPQRVVDLMMEPAFTKMWPITAGQALTWAAAGPLATITDTSNNANSPIRASCLAFLLAMNAGRDVDMGDAKVKAQFDIWLQNGLIDQQHYNNIIALATGPASRVDILGIPVPTARDILDALEA
jgi:hypothetical protein